MRAVLFGGVLTHAVAVAQRTGAAQSYRAIVAIGFLCFKITVNRAGVVFKAPRSRMTVFWALMSEYLAYR
jgi:hypothetical protein